MTKGGVCVINIQNSPAAALVLVQVVEVQGSEMHYLFDDMTGDTQPDTSDTAIRWKQEREVLIQIQC